LKQKQEGFEAQLQSFLFFVTVQTTTLPVFCQETNSREKDLEIRRVMKYEDV